MYTKERLFEIRSSWVLPNGTIEVVPPECHDDYVPDIYETIKQAEDLCVKISCSWGYDAPISEIYLPRRLTTYQAQILVKINDTLQSEGKKGIIEKCNRWYNHMDWKEIQDSI